MRLLVDGCSSGFLDHKSWRKWRHLASGDASTVPGIVRRAVLQIEPVSELVHYLEATALHDVWQAD